MEISCTALSKYFQLGIVNIKIAEKLCLAELNNKIYLFFNTFIKDVATYFTCLIFQTRLGQDTLSKIFVHIRLNVNSEGFCLPGAC